MPTTVVPQEEPEREPLVKEIPPKAADLSEWYQAVC